MNPRKSMSIIVAMAVLILPESSYGVRPFATENSSTTLGSLRSELRSEGFTYDYQSILDPKARNLVYRREAWAQDVLEGRKYQQKNKFKLYFSGFSFDDKKDPVAPFMQHIIEKVMIDEYLTAALYRKDVTIPLLEEDPEEVAAGREVIDLMKLRYTPWRIPIQAIVFYYESNDVPYHTVSLNKKKYPIPVKAPVWIFEDGLLAINITKLPNKIATVAKALEAVLRFPPPEFKWRIKSRSEVRSNQEWQTAYHYEEVEDKTIRGLIISQEEKIEGALERPVRLYFSGFRFSDSDQPEPSKSLQTVLKDIRLYRFFKAARVDNQVSVPVIEDEPEEANAVDFGKKLKRNDPWLNKLWYSRWRVPVSNLLFFYEPDELFHRVQIEGEEYEIPAKPPVWTFRDGLAAINLAYVIHHPKAVMYSLEGVVSLPPPNTLWDVLPRSELRLEAIHLPQLASVGLSKAKTGLTAFGIQAGQGFILDADLIQSGNELALALVLFRYVPFVILGTDKNQAVMKSIVVMNKKLASLNQPTLSIAWNMDDAFALLNRQMELKNSEIKPGRSQFRHKQIILSSKSPLSAETLKKQLGDQVIIRTFSLEKFSQIAFGSVQRFGLTGLAEELQQQVLNQFLITKSA